MDDPLAALAANPIFAHLSAEARQRLAASGTMRRYGRGEQVLAEGDPAGDVYALVRGAVRVFHRSRDGKEVLLKLFRVPAIFGEAESFSGMPFLQHVDAVEETDLLVLPVADVLRALATSAMGSLCMLLDVADRLAIASRNEKSLAFDPVPLRLASYLLDYGAWTNDPDAVELRLDLTQGDMAAALGVSRRAVVKEITAWQKAGILERRGKHYLMNDPTRLRRLVKRPLRLSYRMSADRLAAILAGVGSGP